jgi:hypothetical protein
MDPQRQRGGSLRAASHRGRIDTHKNKRHVERRTKGENRKRKSEPTAPKRIRIGTVAVITRRVALHGGFRSHFWHRAFENNRHPPRPGADESATAAAWRRIHDTPRGVARLCHSGSKTNNTKPMGVAQQGQQRTHRESRITQVLTGPRQSYRVASRVVVTTGAHSEGPQAAAPTPPRVSRRGLHPWALDSVNWRIQWVLAQWGHNPIPKVFEPQTVGSGFFLDVDMMAARDAWSKDNG